MSQKRPINYSEILEYTTLQISFTYSMLSSRARGGAKRGGGGVEHLDRVVGKSSDPSRQIVFVVSKT